MATDVAIFLGTGYFFLYLLLPCSFDFPFQSSYSLVTVLHGIIWTPGVKFSSCCCGNKLLYTV